MSIAFTDDPDAPCSLCCGYIDNPHPDPIERMLMPQIPDGPIRSELHERCFEAAVRYSVEREAAP